MFRTRSFSVLLWGALLLPLCAADAPPAFALRSNDVVAFIGGSDVAAAQFTGHVETLLTVKFPGTRFRNFGWEGDTVFAQPRDVGFPSLTNHLRRAGVTVLFLEYGRAEALDGKRTTAEFSAAYGKLISELSNVSPRIILIVPPPFETANSPLPDLSSRNVSLAAHLGVVRKLGLPPRAVGVDFWSEFGGVAHREPRLTDNGLQFTPQGHAYIAAAFARRLGFGELAADAGTVNEHGEWSNLQFERLRQIVIEKNKLWFNYWRPQNWAFLGGDRTTQPSSRDHRDPKVRWFPAEMEKYVPLIAAKETEMETVASGIRGVR